MGENWVGKAVSIKCVDDYGIFQGVIKDADSSKIVITRAFCNGLPIKTLDTEVTISASDIVKISLIPSHNAANVNSGISTSTPNSNNRNNGRESPANYTILRRETNASPSQHAKTMSTSKSQMNNRNNFGNFIPPKVEVKMAHNGGASGGGGGASGGGNMNLSKNGQKQPRQNDGAAFNGSAAGGSNGLAAQQIQAAYKQQQQQQGKKKKNNQANLASVTFGGAVDEPGMDKDFDFEGNLALFNKLKVFNEIDANHHKPDVVRQTGHANKKNYRHDENILKSKPMGLRQIQMKHSGALEYVTDDGIIIPTISSVLRSRIQTQAEMVGLVWERQCDMLSRSTVELALQMLGGARRLSPKNQHQWPKIAIICDEMCDVRHSDVGFSTGRQLSSQGLQVHILVKPNINVHCSREADLFKATGNAVTMTIDELPSSDLIILAVPKPITDLNVIKWITDSRAPLMAVDPPTTGISNLSIKCSILPMLPLENISESCGKLYLSNLTIPDKFFRDAGITYKSPFGHKFVIPLHIISESAAESQ